MREPGESEMKDMRSETMSEVVFVNVRSESAGG
jgi:hypothetical protein